MKILFATKNPQNHQNPYVLTLINGLKKENTNIECYWGAENFWSDQVLNYDIIHIMWPENLLTFPSAKYKTADELYERFVYIQKQSIKIVSTCHNLKPHYNQDPNFIKAYELVYTFSEHIYHLGQFSLNLFRNKYPNSKHLLLYHHIYDDRYITRPTKKESREKLCLSSNKKYILCFGKFRDKEERDLIIKLQNGIKRSNICILAPSFFLVTKRRNVIKLLISSITFLYYKLRFRSIKMYYMPVKEEDLAYYFTAADIVLIQRKQILNSGNLPLAFYFKKVVVGPSIGNVGEILKETSNPIFNPNDIDSLYKAINNAFLLSADRLGLKNYHLCCNKFSSSTICKQLFIYYQELIQKDQHSQ